MDGVFAFSAPGAAGYDGLSQGQRQHEILGAIIEAIKAFGGSAHQDLITDFISARAASLGADPQATRDSIRSVLEGQRALAWRQAGALRPMFGPDSKRWTLMA